MNAGEVRRYGRDFLWRFYESVSVLRLENWSRTESRPQTEKIPFSGRRPHGPVS